jgi:hypothetical protein
MNVHRRLFNQQAGMTLALNSENKQDNTNEDYKEKPKEPQKYEIITDLGTKEDTNKNEMIIQTTGPIN